MTLGVELGRRVRIIASQYERQSVGGRHPAEVPQVTDRFRQAFMSAYTGPLLPSDALWWLEHPEDQSPRGEYSPAARLDAARVLLFTPHQTADALEQYHELARLLAENERATTQAVAVAEQTSSPVTTARWEAPATRRRSGGLSGGAFVAVTLALVTGLVIGAAWGRGIGGSSRPMPTASRIFTLQPSVALQDPTAAGKTLLRMSNSSPQVGGSLPESGTSAFESPLLSEPHVRIRLTATCTGGDGLLIVPGADGLVANNYISLDCPAGQPATFRTFLASSATAKPFHLVVYERQPVLWKLLLSVDQG